VGIEVTATWLTALTFESVDNVKWGDGLALGMLSVGDGVTNYTFEESLQNTTCLLIDCGRDTLDTTATSQTAYRGLRNTFNGISGDSAVTSGPLRSKTFATFSTPIVGKSFR
jgi:hypothetical protein